MAKKTSLTEGLLIFFFFFLWPWRGGVRCGERGARLGGAGVQEGFYIHVQLFPLSHTSNSAKLDHIYHTWLGIAAL